MITTSVSPADGPLGDSTLSVDDGEVRILNQNDARPRDIDAILDFGSYDGHLLQFSGAIWWPVVYELAEATKSAVGARKRINGMARAQRFIETVGARFVFPNSGPACFLDRDLFAFNDFTSGLAELAGPADNPFPDQTVFLRYLAGNGIRNGRLLIPSSVAELTPAGCTVTHPMPDDEVDRIFIDKRSYLEDMLPGRPARSPPLAPRGLRTQAISSRLCVSGGTRSWRWPTRSGQVSGTWC